MPADTEDATRVTTSGLIRGTGNAAIVARMMSAAIQPLHATDVLEWARTRRQPRPVDQAPWNSQSRPSLRPAIKRGAHARSSN
jgi:hypothetical protein